MDDGIGSSAFWFCSACESIEYYEYVEKISLIVKEFGVLIVVGIVGIGIILYGMWEELVPEKARVEVIKNKDTGSVLGSGGEITVDVGGAVEKPGVYQLPSGSRIGDALVVAGGLAGEADREWIAKTINLAEAVEDGEKVYIPATTQTISNPLGQKSGKVNINTATFAELDALEGIGEVRARTILDNRPYSKVSDLVDKAKIPESVYEKIRDKITVY